MGPPVSLYFMHVNTLIRCLEDALALAEQLDDGMTEYLIERALDEARSRQFKPATDRH
jgi:hypothetical protein